MSADNYLTVERNGEGWSVFDGCASTYWKKARQAVFATRDDAIDEAQKIQCDEIVEYGISYIEPLTKTSDKGDN